MSCPFFLRCTRRILEGLTADSAWSGCQHGWRQFRRSSISISGENMTVAVQQVPGQVIELTAEQLKQVSGGGFILSERPTSNGFILSELKADAGSNGFILSE
jgi:hypothetical protein